VGFRGDEVERWLVPSLAGSQPADAFSLGSFEDRMCVHVACHVARAGPAAGTSRRRHGAVGDPLEGVYVRDSIALVVLRTLQPR
jgi:hypothetical protein